ncbi:MAG TPA: hypothetical protein PLD63_04260 [Ignavibacteria bacterium]|nr:hypothetical protein [Ignavibacteria bacterium]HQY51562.1 hypothetical protein [Ignavibacteria bacterium]
MNSYRKYDSELYKAKKYFGVSSDFFEGKRDGNEGGGGGMF